MTRGPRFAPCCQTELQEEGRHSKPERAARAALSGGSYPAAREEVLLPRNYLLNYPARQEPCANVAMGRHKNRAQSCSQPSAGGPEPS